MEKNLKYFMRDDTDEIITVPGLKRFKDEKGEIIPFQIRKLSQAEVEKITNGYTERCTALDKRGNPIITASGEVAVRTKRDNEKWARHLMVEAMVFPNLKDPELMEFYKCVDIAEMPLKVFKTSEDYQYVFRKVMSVLGIGSFELDEEDIIEEAKN